MMPVARTMPAAEQATGLLQTSSVDLYCSNSTCRGGKGTAHFGSVWSWEQANLDRRGPGSTCKRSSEQVEGRQPVIAAEER